MANVSAPLIALGCALAVPAWAQDRMPETEALAAFTAANCTIDPAESVAKIEPFDLGGGKTLYKFECWRESFKSGFVLLLDEGKGAKPLKFSLYDGQKWGPSTTLADVDYVPQSGTLTSFNKGNAEAECGGIGVWHWTGSEFKMTGYWYKAKCDGYQLEGQRRYKIR